MSTRTDPLAAVFAEIGLGPVASSLFETLYPDTAPTPDEARRWAEGFALFEGP